MTVMIKCVIINNMEGTGQVLQHVDRHLMSEYDVQCPWLKDLNILSGRRLNMS